MSKKINKNALFDHRVTYSNTNFHDTNTETLFLKIYLVDRFVFEEHFEGF